MSALRDYGRPSALPPLIYALGDPDVTVATAARNALEELTGESFRSKGSQSPTIVELREEWGQWIDWFAEKYDNVDSKTNEVFKMYVQRSLQSTNFGLEQSPDNKTMHAKPDLRVPIEE